MCQIAKNGLPAAIPKQATLYPMFEGDDLEFDSSDYPQEAVEESQWPWLKQRRYHIRKS